MTCARLDMNLIGIDVIDVRLVSIRGWLVTHHVIIASRDNTKVLLDNLHVRHVPRVKFPELQLHLVLIALRENTKVLLDNLHV